MEGQGPPPGSYPPGYAQSLGPPSGMPPGGPPPPGFGMPPPQMQFQQQQQGPPGGEMLPPQFQQQQQQGPPGGEMLPQQFQQQPQQGPPGGEMLPPPGEGQFLQPQQSGDGQFMMPPQQQQQSGEVDEAMEGVEEGAMPARVPEGMMQHDGSDDMMMQQQQQQEKEEPQEPSPDPQPTIYVNNMNEKIRGEKLHRGLRQVFAPYGKIHRIAVRKGIKFHGQAFITYGNTESAMEAVAKTQGYNFYGKPLRVTFARSKADITLKAEGMEVPKRPAHPRKGMVAVKIEKKEGAAAAAPPAGGVMPAMHGAYPPGPYPGMLMPPGMMGGPHNGSGGGGGYGMPAPAPLMPHNILFASNLPEAASEAMLAALFQQYPGFKEVRLVPGKGVAFLDFGSEPEATVAMQALNNFRLDPEHAMALSYARK